MLTIPFYNDNVGQLQSWLLNQALPLWSQYGVDRECGGFFEKLHFNLTPTIEPRRSRLVARQIYMFAVGASLGWDGDANDLIQHGYHFLCRHLVSQDGQVFASCTDKGELIDDRQYLYDVAFVLLALAKITEKQPENSEAENLARAISMRLSSHYAHPKGGYIEETLPLLQCANPHMHLFEAFLAWTILSRCQDPFWFQRAEEISRLALSRLIQTNSGLLPEHFDTNWCPVRQNDCLRIEPGHQFEWSWLLSRWSLISGDRKAGVAGAKLCLLAETYGVDHRRNVVVECINEQMLIYDFTARLWQQTERIKAWHMQMMINGPADAYSNREAAIDSLLTFLASPRPGLWYDEMDPTGHLLDQPVKASSGYHIVCAIESLLESSLFTKLIDDNF